MTIDEHIDEIIADYKKGDKLRDMAGKYKTETKEIVTALRDKGYPVTWNMIGKGNIMDAITKYEEKVLEKKGKLEQEDVDRIEKAKKAAMLEKEWRTYSSIRQVLDEMMTDYIKGEKK